MCVGVGEGPVTSFKVNLNFPKFKGVQHMLWGGGGGGGASNFFPRGWSPIAKRYNLPLSRPQIGAIIKNFNGLW